MLDIKFIRENPELIKAAAKKKNLNINIDELIIADNKRLSFLAQVEALRARQNKTSEEIARAGSDEERDILINLMRGVKDELNRVENALREIMETWRKLMLAVPNVPDVSVPDGMSDSQNVEIRTFGQKPVFYFPPKSHSEILEKIEGVDFERGSKVSGFRGYFLKGAAVELSLALWQFGLQHLLKKGFTPMIVPSLVRKENLFGSGYLPQGKDDLYHDGEDDYFAGTGEVASMGYHMDEILSLSELPKKFVSFSPCFRKEAGSHGKDTKGLIRVHEFFKIEQVVLCEASHETSVTLHEELTKNAEEILQALNLPYRVVVNCGGDLGLGQVKKYDIETWVPSEGAYRETHSSSYFHDFQTRRLNIRYRDEGGKLRFVHSLNNTLLATPRLLVPILENNQLEDGRVMIPKALQPFIGKEIFGSAGLS